MIKLHQNVAVCDATRFVNRVHVSNVFGRMTPLTLEYKKHDNRKFRQLDNEQNTQVYDKLRKNRFTENLDKMEYFIQTSLALFSEASSLHDGCCISVSFERVLPGKQTWSYHSGPCGILCIERDGTDEFKASSNLHYPEVTYEVIQGYMIMYHDMYHRQSEILEHKDQIVFRV